MLTQYSNLIGFEMELIADWVEATSLNIPVAKTRSLSPLSSSSINTSNEVPLPALPQMPARATLLPSRKSGELVRENSRLANSYNTMNETSSWYSWFWGSEQS
ncbi:hypothetical protein BGZ76_001034 [Entomortierella beljakovae]|nr:hypothetical protein BGZ76_001034 [Entomortierella beljakovae]